MNDSAQIEYFYPNKMGRIILQALEEILGRNGINALLNLSNQSSLINNYLPNNMDREYSFTELSQLLLTLENLYGTRGGRGLALRAGRACLKYGLREFAPAIGLTDLEFRLLPLNEKTRKGLQILADTFNQYTDQKVIFAEYENRYTWQIEICPFCWQRAADEKICHLQIGMIQELLYWITGGKFYNVEETHCQAIGDSSCDISIDKLPLE